MSDSERLVGALIVMVLLPRRGFFGANVHDSIGINRKLYPIWQPRRLAAPLEPKIAERDIVLRTRFRLAKRGFARSFDCR